MTITTALGLSRSIRERSETLNLRISAREQQQTKTRRRPDASEWNPKALWNERPTSIRARGFHHWHASILPAGWMKTTLKAHGVVAAHSADATIMKLETNIPALMMKGNVPGLAIAVIRNGLDSRWRLRLWQRLPACFFGRSVCQTRHCSRQLKLPSRALGFLRVPRAEPRAPRRPQGQRRLHGPGNIATFGAIQEMSRSSASLQAASRCIRTSALRFRAACSKRRSASLAVAATACSPGGR